MTFGDKIVVYATKDLIFTKDRLREFYIAENAASSKVKKIKGHRLFRGSVLLIGRNRVKNILRARKTQNMQRESRSSLINNRNFACACVCVLAVCQQSASCCQVCGWEHALAGSVFKTKTNWWCCHYCRLSYFRTGVFTPYTV